MRWPMSLAIPCLMEEYPKNTDCQAGEALFFDGVLRFELMSVRESLRATDLPSWTRLPWVDIAAVNAGVEKRPEILRLLIVMFF